jgi:malto-oligosyltrehalose synthase
MYNPISTYRIQFNASFGTKDLKKHIEYLSLLGIRTIYASPIFTATPGSLHGYDITNPWILNPEITTSNEFTNLGKLIHETQMGWLQDIVPNHMAYNPENLWIMDVLEKGTDSDFYDYFDFEPGTLEKDKKLMVPFLGCHLDEVLNNNEIKLGLTYGNISVNYYDNKYPVNFSTFRKILKGEISKSPEALQTLWDDYKIESSKGERIFLNSDWDDFKTELQDLYTEDKKIAKFIDKLLAKISESKEDLNNILNNQYYELCHWQDAERRINYRRFFTVNGLICLRQENDNVFSQYHQLIFSLINDGMLQGLRIDHIDGLNNPTDYLNKLREKCGDKTYIVAEKILETDEDLPWFWPIQGTTGYDFLSIVNNLLTSTRHYDKLKSLYKEITHQNLTPDDLIYQNKRMILTTRMHGEWDNIYDYFVRLKLVDYNKADISHEIMKEAIGEFMLACPVYRLYPRKFPLDKHNKDQVKEILDLANTRNPALARSFEIMSEIFLNSENQNDDYHQKVYMFFTRLMQYTGPLMAKGVEDTSMYQYRCFITHNEVGDAINASGITISEFHEKMLERQKNWPLSMNTTSTHDTKRGEDVRARLNVISEISDEWEEKVNLWMQMNQKLKKRLESGLLEPSLSVEYFIYQTLMGTYPPDGQHDETYLQRIDEYLVKALRESKRKVSWRDPDASYENTVCEFARSLLDKNHEFLESFVALQQKIVWGGVINSLIQLTLKCTCPGIPDIYQGTELWDLTLVDPDNRQPVDYSLRHKVLKKLLKKHADDPQETITKLIKSHHDGHIKLLLTSILLNLRKDNPTLFSDGKYVPLTIQGNFDAHVLAFARVYKNQHFIVAVPLFLASLATQDKEEIFSDTGFYNAHIMLPEEIPGKWKNILTGEKIISSEKIPLRGLFVTGMPALLMSAKDEI